MAVENGDGKKLITIDEMVPYVGEFKLFQWMVGGIFCVMMIPSTYQVLIIYFVTLTPSWRCTQNTSVEAFNCSKDQVFASDNDNHCKLNRSHWQYTESKDYSLVTYFDISCDTKWVIQFSTSIFFIGSATGSVILGWAADNYGRKLIIFISMFAIVIFGFVNAFIPNLWCFLAFRFLIGIFIPGSNIQMSVLLSEMTGSKYRPLSGNLAWTFFPVALCILSLQAYFIRTYKVLFIVCTAPYVFIFIFYKFVPESVRWLKLQNKKAELMETFQRIAYWNKRRIPDGVAIDTSNGTVNRRRYYPIDLFRPREMLYISLNQGFGLFMHGLVYYGLSLASEDIGGSLYLNFFLLSLIEIPSGIASIYVCHRFGRKDSTIVGVLTAGVACIILAFIPTPYRVARIVLAMIGKLCIACSFNTIGIWAIELYPTCIRGQAMSYIKITCRIGAASSPLVISGLKVVHRYAPFLCLGIIALASGGLLCLMTETKGLPTLETVKGDDSLIQQEC